MTPWCPLNKLEWYNIITLLAKVSGVANSAFFFSGVVTSLNNKESNKIYFSANVSTFHMADLANYFVLDISINLWSMGWLSIMPVFHSQVQVNVFLLEPFFALFLIFCLDQTVLAKHLH